MTRPFGMPETPKGRKGWKQNSNGKPNNWALNWSPSNSRLHNDPIQRGEFLGSHGIYRQLSSSPYRIDHFSCANCRTKEAVTPKSVSCRSELFLPDRSCGLAYSCEMAGDLPVEANCTGY